MWHTMLQQHNCFNWWQPYAMSRKKGQSSNSRLLDKVNLTLVKSAAAASTTGTKFMVVEEKFSATRLSSSSIMLLLFLSLSNLVFRDFSNSSIWRSHFRGKPPRSHGLFSFANIQGFSVRWHLVAQVANWFTTGQQIEGIPMAENWNEIETSYFGIHLGNQKSSLQCETRAGSGSQLLMVACPRRYSPLVRNSGLGQPFHSVLWSSSSDFSHFSSSFTSKSRAWLEQLTTFSK